MIQTALCSRRPLLPRFNSNANNKMTTPVNLLRVPAPVKGGTPDLVPVDLDVVGIVPLSRLVKQPANEPAHLPAQRGV
jgi:hypothetical protein